ncbi:YaaR family protein [Carboxydochorda subterranea]|uniref:YaaR family protein n=1 Tax=Carboxydichorda subterranea TaxID=3109565 RepID=A0ABZ1BYN6_9FIRM|nr:YaaR family protein [Limnochorda sp. L945t]WRP17630.1 YaaR family protein [Limnochorda sp. L945t]
MESARIEGLPRRRRPTQIGRPRAGSTARTASGERPAGVFRTELADADRRRRRQEMEQALREVDRCAGELRRSPGEATVFAYRQAVRRLLELALAGTYRVDRRVAVDGRGQRRLHAVIQEVDAALDRLVRDVLARQQPALALAARLDDIRGLLLDLVR